MRTRGGATYFGNALISGSLLDILFFSDTIVQLLRPVIENVDELVCTVLLCTPFQGGGLIWMRGHQTHAVTSRTQLGESHTTHELIVLYVILYRIDKNV